MMQYAVVMMRSVVMMQYAYRAVAMMLGQKMAFRYGGKVNIWVGVCTKLHTMPSKLVKREARSGLQ
jgi:hypothetical protein